MNKLRKPVFKLVEAELYQYRETKKEIERVRQQIMYGSPQDENTGGGRGNLPTDPTGSVATALVINKRLQNMESVVHAIETVYEKSDEHHKRLIELKYWTNPQTLTWEGIAQKLYVGRMTAFRWRNEIIYSIAELMGWR